MPASATAELQRTSADGAIPAPWDGGALSNRLLDMAGCRGGRCTFRMAIGVPRADCPEQRFRQGYCLPASGPPRSIASSRAAWTYATPRKAVSESNG